MKTTLLFLLFSASFLSPLVFAGDEQAEQTQAATEAALISGGDGRTMETAVVLHIEGPEVVRMEHLIYFAVYKTRPAKQSLRRADGRVYDVLVGEDESQVLYFDITAYWHHSYGEN